MAVKTKKFRKVELDVEAVQFDGKNSKDIADWVKANGEQAQARGSYVNIITYDELSRAVKGDWVIHGNDGEFYVRKPHVFVRNYKAVR